MPGKCYICDRGVFGHRSFYEHSASTRDTERPAAGGQPKKRRGTDYTKSKGELGSLCCGQYEYIPGVLNCRTTHRQGQGECAQTGQGCWEHQRMCDTFMRKQTFH